MTYADVAYANETYGEAFIKTSCDRDLDGNLDTTAFERALIRATNKINSYIAGRAPAAKLAEWSLDPETAPEILRKICLDLAIEDAAPHSDVATNKKSERAKAALQELKDIRDGKIRLVEDDEAPAPQPVLPLQSSLETERARSLVIDCGARTFTRSKMRDL